MGLWQRFTLLFKSKANTALDKAEDPRETLDYSYEKQLALLQKVRRGVVVLSFGKQVDGGANGFGKNILNSEMVATTSAWAAGLAECGPGPWEVAIGTSNSGGVTAFNGYLGGRSWSKLVAAARAESDPRVVISGAVDLEPGWGPSGQARAWVDGYVDSTTARLWNFGSADGCP